MKTRHEAFPSAIGSLSKNQTHQRGIALLLVLWVITLLTVIALGMTSTQRTEIALAANQVLSATFRAQADAAIYVAALNLLTQPPPEATADRTAMENMGFWVPDGQPQLWRMGETAMEIRVINEASLIDLNQAEPGLLLALLKAVGIEEQESARMLDAILDWRDPDNLHLANGAEDDDYAAAGLPYGAKDGPFDSVEELRQLIGFKKENFRALAPALTVYSGQASPVPDFAPPLVQAALQGIGLEEMEDRLAEEAEVMGQQTPVVGRGGPLYRITVRWQGPGGAYRTMQALTKVEAGSPSPVTVLWRRYALIMEDE